SRPTFIKVGIVDFIALNERFKTSAPNYVPQKSVCHIQEFDSSRRSPTGQTRRLTTKMEDLEIMEDVIRYAASERLNWLLAHLTKENSRFDLKRILNSIQTPDGVCAKIFGLSDFIGNAYQDILCKVEDPRCERRPKRMRAPQPRPRPMRTEPGAAVS
ncbi:MAG: hypothetical protein AAF203_08095, partial [Pseudomonadota bacterium]